MTLVVYLICDILLTPVGFETRPLNGITTLGFVTLALIFVGLATIIASLALLSRNSRLSSNLAMIGLLLYFPAFISDRTGYFASLASPTAITVVEVIQAIVAAIGLVLAWRLYREKSSSA